MFLFRMEVVTGTLFNTNNAMIVGDDEPANLTKTVDLTTANKKNYRWKVYRDIVKPKNL